MARGLRFQSNYGSHSLIRRSIRYPEAAPNRRFSSRWTALTSISERVPDTPNGNCHLLVAIALTIESEPASTKVVERCADRIVFRCGPVESVRVQSRIPAIIGIAAAAEHRIEPGVASD